MERRRFDARATRRSSHRSVLRLHDDRERLRPGSVRKGQRMHLTGSAGLDDRLQTGRKHLDRKPFRAAAGGLGDELAIHKLPREPRSRRRDWARTSWGKLRKRDLQDLGAVADSELDLSGG